MIDARSCERFRLLSLHISDEKLKSFIMNLWFRRQVTIEHFLDLARQYCPAAKSQIEVGRNAEF